MSAGQLQSTQFVLEHRFGRSSGAARIIDVVGPTVLYAPAAGKRIRLKWLALATPETNVSPVEATITLDSVAIYQWPLGVPGVFSHSSVREGGPDGTLTLTLSAPGQRVFVNLDIEEFP